MNLTGIDSRDLHIFTWSIISLLALFNTCMIVYQVDRYES